MTELKPCPFCGSSSMSAAKHDEGCFIRLYFEDILLHRKRSPEEYEKAWNTRAVTVDVEHFCEVSGL